MIYVIINSITPHTFNMDIEIWKPVMGFPDYEISSWGRIKSRRRKTEKIFTFSNDGRYKQRRLTNQNGHTQVLIHRLVAEHFIPNPDNLPMVLHGDDNPSNNHYLNLRWGTHQDNMDDKKTKGRQSRVSRYKITWCLVSPEGVTISTNNLKTFCKERGLDQGGLNKVVRGERKTHKGWTCQVCPLVL